MGLTGSAGGSFAANSRIFFIVCLKKRTSPRSIWRCAAITTDGLVGALNLVIIFIALRLAFWRRRYTSTPFERERTNLERFTEARGQLFPLEDDAVELVEETGVGSFFGEGVSDVRKSFLR